MGELLLQRAALRLVVTWIRPSTGRFSRYAIHRLVSTEAGGGSFYTGSVIVVGAQRSAVADEQEFE